MNYFGIVGLFNGIVALLTGLYVFFKDRRSQLYISFSAFTISVALWSIFYSIWQSQESKESALFFVRLLMAPCYYVPFAFFWFTLTLLEVEERKRYLPLCLGIPTFFFLFSFSRYNIRDVTPRLYFPYWPVPGLLMHVYVALFFIVVIYTFYLLLQGWYRSSGMRRWQLRWVTVTMLLTWSGGSTNWFLWYNIPIPPFPNVFVGVFLLLLAYAIIRRQLFDVDTLADIIQEAKLSAIGTLAAGINHEIRNPLFAAKGYSESLLSDIKEGLFDTLSTEEGKHRIRGALEKAIEQINRVVEISRQFTEFTKPGSCSSSRERVLVGEVVDRVLSFVGHELEIEKVKVEKKIADDTTIYADRRQMEEILLNLMVNAYQAMPDGGILEISGERKDGRVSLKISDTGAGIPADAIKRIFDPFFSTKRDKGMGLGLYIVKKLVERNDGTVKVASELNKGTTFILEFTSLAGHGA